MKDHIRQPCVLLEVLKSFFNDSGLARTPILKADYKVIVLIFFSEKRFQVGLRFSPVSQNIGERPWKPDFLILESVFGFSRPLL